MPQTPVGHGTQGSRIGLTQVGRLQYAAAQFVIGIWEFHLNDLDPELIRDFNEYLPTLAREPEVPGCAPSR